MAASNETELFNFEGNINEAFRHWLEDNLTELQTSNDLAVLPDEYVGAMVEIGAANPNHMQRKPNGEAEYDQYDLTLNFTVLTKRTEEEASGDDTIPRRHHELVANVRRWIAISNAKPSALQSYLTLYTINRLVPDGAEYDHDDANDEDETVLSFAGTFSILTDAWPVS